MRASRRNDHVVYIGACPNQHVVPLLDYILPRYGLNPALVGSNYIWGWETNRIARELVERAGGTVKAERFVPLGDTDIGHIIAEIGQKRPDFVFNTLIGPSSHAFVEAYHAPRTRGPGLRPDSRPIVSCNWTEDEVAALGVQAPPGTTPPRPISSRWRRRPMPTCWRPRRASPPTAGASRPSSSRPIPRSMSSPAASRRPARRRPMRCSPTARPRPSPRRSARSASMPRPTMPS